MNPGVFIAIYLPLFMVLFVILPTNRRHKFAVRKLKKRRGEKIMSNELLKSCVGKTCTISTGSFGSSYNNVEIVEVVDNWIKVKGKRNSDIINIDFITNIKIHE